MQRLFKMIRQFRSQYQTVFIFTIYSQAKMVQIHALSVYNQRYLFCNYKIDIPAHHYCLQLLNVLHNNH